jgi:phage portal protein BeeE
MPKGPPKEVQKPISETLVGVLPAGQPRTPPFSRRLAVSCFRSWLYAAINLNAKQVAATPLRLYSRKGGKNGASNKLFRTREVPTRRKAYLLGDTDHVPSTRTIAKMLDYGTDFEEVTESHPATELLRKVNPWMGGFDLLTLTIQFADLTGDWYWFPVPGPMGPSELWVLPSQWVEIVPSRTDFIAGYLFGRNRAEAVKFTTDELLHGKFPNPNDVFYGLGSIEAGWGIVQKIFAMEQMDLATFQNMARPDYLISVKSGAKQKEIDAFADDLKSKLQGVKKAGHFAAVSGDVSVMPLSWPPKDIAGRDLTIEEASAITGVPVTILRANDPNLASAQIGYASWKEMTILPKCRSLEDFLNQQVLPLFGIEDEACFAFDDPVPRNRAEDRADAESELRTGRKTLNEMRVEHGMPAYPIAEADMPLVNNQPLGYIAPVQSFGSPMAAPSSKPEEDDDEDEKPQPVEEKAMRQAVTTPPVALLTERGEIERLQEIVKSHNADHPGARVSDFEAFAMYERAKTTTVDDAMAELMELVRDSIDDGSGALDIVLKELEHAS